MQISPFVNILTKCDERVVVLAQIHGLACPNFDHRSVWVTTTCTQKDWQGIWI